MKVLILVSMIVTATATLFAQTADPEKDFQRNKAKFTREHFVMGEDATSGYDYLFYKRQGKIGHIRSIWTASYTKEIRVEDFYFRDGLALLKRSKGQRRNYVALKAGRDVVLVPTEELHFENERLVRWIENGKSIDHSDKRWSEMEKATLEHAKGELESYDFLKDNK